VFRGFLSSSETIMRDPVREFQEFNRPFARRSPELLRLKVARMAEGPFAFFRGTFHLFARDVLAEDAGALPLLSGSGPELTLVGDVHAENFGAYKADDGLVHYDVNDFDEATSGRFDFDACRLATSHFLAAREHGADLPDAARVVLAGLSSYADTVRRLLKKTADRNLDYNENCPSHCPAVDALLAAGAAAKRPDFIGRLTETHNGKRRLKRSLNFFNLPDAEREQAVRLLADYRARHHRDDVAKDYYEVDDVCGRVSGIGSMGRLRYVVLVHGKGGPARNVLLEFKESRPSAYDVCRGRDLGPEALVKRAEHVYEVQKRAQAASSAHLGWAVDGGLSFQARELGPADARVDPKALKGADVLAGVARVQGAVLARIHARSAADAVGPANPLAELADPDAFAQRVLAFALAYADLTRRDWGRFVGARADLEDVSSWAGAAARAKG
jgi:uncharacterized protein (DUF2252 family)